MLTLLPSDILRSVTSNMVAELKDRLVPFNDELLLPTDLTKEEVNVFSQTLLNNKATPLMMHTGFEQRLDKIRRSSDLTIPIESFLSRFANRASCNIQRDR